MAVSPSDQSCENLSQLPTLHCIAIDAWAVRRPWLTFVNAFANSILERFYTAKTEDLHRALGLWYCENRGIGGNEKMNADSTAQRNFCRCCWNRRDVILFSVVRIITASRENRGELLSDEIIKTASHRNHSLQVTLTEFEQLLQGGKWELVCGDFSHDH